MDYHFMKTVIKSRNNKNLRFCQDHQYKTNFEKWVLTDETYFWLKNTGEKMDYEKRGLYSINDKNRESKD